MQRIRFLLILAFLCAVARGAWALDFSVKNETELKDAMKNDGANITLTATINISSAITVGNGQTVTINLGGHTLNRGCTSRGSQVIGVFSGGTLYLSNGTVTGGWGGGGGAMFNEGTMHLTNVTISGNTADDRGGGLSNNGTLTMTGCTVSNNTCRDATSPAGGGGIFNYEGKTATLTNCTITGNTTNTYGGGGICNYGTMTLNNCSLSSNNATTKGGGIFCSTTSTLSINGCDITGNIAVGYGDGIYIDNSTLKMQGLCTVTGNNDGNIYLNGSGTVITVTGAFTDGSNIGVGFSDYGRKFTSGYSTYNSGHEPGDFFTSDNGYYAIGKKDGEAYPGVPYWDHSWDGSDTDGHVVSTKKILTDSYSEYNGATDLYSGWYVFRGSHTYDNRIACHGDVKFILQDGSNAEFKSGIHIDNPQHLTIYAQDNGSGILRCTGGGGENAAIGGNDGQMSGHLVIHGGEIYAEASSSNAAGIGGGDGSDSGMQSVTIWDGIVTAKAKSSGAGIGSGQDNANGHCPIVKIYGGTVTATGSKWSAGIGGGENSAGGDVTIWGGTVTATGGHKGAGIGGGQLCVGGNVTIYSGTVEACGLDGGAGIGGGVSGNQGGTVTIWGGDIEAKGRYEASGTDRASGAGIGGGGTNSSDDKPGNGGVVNIHGGNIKLNPLSLGGPPRRGAAGIGGGSNYNYDAGGDGGTVTITGGTIEISSADTGIGGGTGGKGGTTDITGGTIKIHVIGYGMYIGNGGDIDGYVKPTPSVGNLTLGSGMKVSNSTSSFDACSPVASNQRKSTCEKNEKGYLIISVCDHSSGATYSVKDDTYHTARCANCDGIDEAHTYDNDVCTKCGKGRPEHTITFYEANNDGTGYTSRQTYTVAENQTFTLPEFSYWFGKHLFVGWELAESAPESLTVDDATGLAKPYDEINITVDSSDRSYYARYKTCWSGDGSGTSNDPYIIASTTDLNSLSSYSALGFTYDNMYFKVTNDLTYDGQSNYTAIGTSTNPFNGNFDGGGHTIKGYSFTATDDNQGLFGYVGASGTVKNVTVNSGSISAASYSNIGAIAGTNLGKLSNCVVAGTVLSGSSNVASIAGYNDGIVEGCISQQATGITGANGSNASVEHCLQVLIDGKHLVNTTGSTAAYTVGSNTLGLTLDYGTPTATYDYDGIKVYSFDQGDNTTLEGLLWKNLLFVGGTTKVTFNANAPEGQAAANVTADNGTVTHNTGDSHTLAMNNADVLVTATMVDKTYVSLDLLDAPGAGDTSNEATLDTNDGQTVNATLKNRTLYKDGCWNTLCLPFDVTATQLSIDQHPLYDVTIMELDTQGKYNAAGNLDEDGDFQTGFDAGTETLYLYFKTATSIKARKPYIVKWEKPNDYVAYTGSNKEQCSDVVDPTFYGSYIESSSPKAATSADGKVSFLGNYDPVTLEANDKSSLYLGVSTNDNGTPEDHSDDYQQTALYYPSADRTIKSFRAYFTVDLRADNGGKPNLVRAFSLHFGDEGETTGIVDVEYGILNVGHSTAATGWYTLDGRKLQAKPTQKGVYIYNGKKRIIK